MPDVHILIAFLHVKVEEEMLMHKLYQLMSAEGLIKKVFLCCHSIHVSYFKCYLIDALLYD